MKNYGRKTENEGRRMKDSYRLSFYSPFSIFHSPLYIIEYCCFPLFFVHRYGTHKRSEAYRLAEWKSVCLSLSKLDSSYKYAYKSISRQVNLYKSGESRGVQQSGFCAFMNMDFDRAEAYHKEVQTD